MQRNEYVKLICLKNTWCDENRCNWVICVMFICLFTDWNKITSYYLKKSPESLRIEIFESGSRITTTIMIINIVYVRHRCRGWLLPGLILRERCDFVDGCVAVPYVCDGRLWVVGRLLSRWRRRRQRQRQRRAHKQKLTSRKREPYTFETR